MDKEIKVSLFHLEEIVAVESKKTVGHVLRKVELVEKKEVLKELIKDTIYEAYRNFRDMILAYGMGKESLLIKFNKTEKS